MSRYDVAIVGLGPTGAVLANLCGLHGLRTVVFEQSTDPYPQPRACHLDAEIARVLQQCGFTEALAEVLTVSAGMEYVDATGQRLFTFEDFEREPLLGWHEDYVFIQPQLDTMVRAGLQRFPHVDVVLGSPAPPIDDLLVLARWVVGADGASSATREALGIGLVDLAYDESWLVIDVMLRPGGDVALPGIIQQVCDPRRLATFVPSHAAHRRWEFLLHGDEHPDPWELIAPWGVNTTNAELVRSASYRFHALVAGQWVGGEGGRVFLAGDSAHQMPPFMGQGMCSGIRDAANLAWKFAAVAAGAPLALLDTYEAERRPHALRVVELSVEAGRLIAELADDVAAGAPLRLPHPAPLDERRWSRLPPLELGGAFPIGHQVPQPTVDGRPLDDLLGLGWAWVARDSAFESPDGHPVVLAPAATMGCRAVLVRPDRYVAAAA